MKGNGTHGNGVKEMELENAEVEETRGGRGGRPSWGSEHHIHQRERPRGFDPVAVPNRSSSKPSEQWYERRARPLRCHLTRMGEDEGNDEVCRQKFRQVAKSSRITRHTSRAVSHTRSSRQYGHEP